MQVLCNRCIRGVQSKGERLYKSEVSADSRDSCFWCEATDTELYKIVFIAVSPEYDGTERR